MKPRVGHNPHRTKKRSGYGSEKRVALFLTRTIIPKPKNQIHPWRWRLLTLPTPSMATTLSLSSSSLLHHCAKSTSRSRSSFRLRASLSNSSSSMAATAEKVVPAVIVGGGRVGRALQDMGGGGDVLVKRGEPVPLDFAGPILVCTRNDDLDAVLESTPKSRWSGMIWRFCVSECCILGRNFTLCVWLFCSDQC